MAETVHLYLKLDGVDIHGESTQSSLGRAESIECTSLTFNVEASGAVRTGEAVRTGDAVRTSDITVGARIDKATPLVVKALVQKQTADAVFKFFRPNPAGDGTTEQFFTIAGKSGHVRSAQILVPDTLSPASSHLPPMILYSFSFESVEETYTNGGVTFGWRV